MPGRRGCGIPRRNALRELLTNSEKTTRARGQTDVFLTASAQVRRLDRMDDLERALRARAETQSTELTLNQDDHATRPWIAGLGNDWGRGADRPEALEDLARALAQTDALGGP